MAYRSSTTANGSSSIAAAPVPTGVQAGDIVLLVVTADDPAWSFAAGKWPAGFTPLVNASQTGPDGQGSGVAWKRLTAADTGSYTLGTNPSTQWVAQAVAFTGRHATDNPTAAAAAQNTAGASGTITVTANGLTAATGDDLLWVVAPDIGGATAYLANSGAAPTGFTKRQDQIATAGWSVLITATQDNRLAGATGQQAGSFSNNNAANAGWTAYLIRVPASTGAATITAVPAVARGVTPVPAIGAAHDSTVAAVPAIAAGLAPPANQIVSTTVRAPGAVALGVAPAPTIGSSAATINPPPAAATGKAPAPAVAASATLNAVPAQAAGVTPGATVHVHATVGAAPAIAAGSSPAPAVTATSSLTAPAAAATGTAPAPAIQAAASPVAPPAVAAGVAPAPSVIGTAATIIAAVPGVAAGRAPSPSTTAAVGVQATPAVAAGIAAPVTFTVPATQFAVPAVATARTPVPAVEWTPPNPPPPPPPPASRTFNVGQSGLVIARSPTGIVTLGQRGVATVAGQPGVPARTQRGVSVPAHPGLPVRQ